LFAYLDAVSLQTTSASMIFDNSWKQK